MAEIFGVFTGAISVASLAIQIFDSIQELREFCAAIQDAPEAVGNVLEELEILGDTLLHLYQDQKLDPDAVDPGIRKSLMYVDRVAGELQNIMKDLAKGMDSPRKKRKWGAIRVVMKKSSINGFLTRLERSKSMLSIAIQCATVRLQFEQRASTALVHSLFTQSLEKPVAHWSDMAIDEVLPSPIMQRMKAPVGALEDPADTNVVEIPVCSGDNVPLFKHATSVHKSYFVWVGLGWYKYQYRSQSKAPKAKKITSNRNYQLIDTEEYIERTFIPFSFTGLTGFSMRKTQSYSGWQYTFTPIRTVPAESPVFAICASGDVDSLIDHFRDESATLYDASPDGWTLLHIAAAYARPQMCQWLLQQGIKAEATTNFTQISSLHAVALASGQMESWNYLPGMPCQMESSTEDRVDDITSTIRVLIEHGNLDPMIPRAQGQTTLHSYTGPSEALHYMLYRQQHFQIDREVQNEFGLEILLWNMSQITPHCHGLTRASLGVGQMSEDQVTGSFYIGFGPYQKKFFTQSVSGFTLLHWALWRLSHFEIDKLMKAGSAFASELIDSGADIHARSAIGHTPFDYSLGWNYMNFNTGLWVLSKTDNGNNESVFKHTDHGQDMRPYALVWLQLLRKKGVNLQEYIQTEAVLHKDSGINSPDYVRLDIRRELTVLEYIGKQDIKFRVRDVVVDIDPEVKLPGSWPPEPSFMDYLDREVYLGLKPSADWTFNTLTDVPF